MSALVACILVPLATALSCPLLGQRPVAQRALSLVGVTLFFGVATALLAAVLRDGAIRVTMGGWPAPFGIELVADPLAAGMVLITATMGLATLVFQLSDAGG